MVSDSQFQTAARARQLGNAITTLRNSNAPFTGLTAAQSEAIRYILKHHEKAPLTAAHLMTALHLSQSTVAGIIHRLEDKELITRTAAPGDSRKSLIRPTEKGLQLEEQLRASAAQTQQILFRGMTEEEQREFDRLLELALRNIQNAREAGHHESN